MKIKNAFVFLTVLALSSACGKRDKDDSEDTPVHDDPALRLAAENPTPMRGYKTINALVRDRLLSKADFQLLHYVQSPDPMRDARGGSILPLFGGYEGRGTTMSNSTAIPSTMNMLLWFSVMDGLATDMAKHCTNSEEAVGVRDDVKATLVAICDPAQDPRENLGYLWDLALRHDSSAILKQEWLDFHTTATETHDPFSDRTALVKDALTTALFTPEFLAGR